MLILGSDTLNVNRLRLHGLFVINGAQVTQRRMATLAIVKDFDVLEDGKSCVIPSRKIFMVYQFRFQGSEKTFRHGVIPAVRLAAHTANHAMSEK